MPLGADLEFQVEITGTSTITPGLILTRYLRLRDFYTADELLFVAYFACGPNLFAVRAQDSVGNVEPVAHGENGVETAVDCYIHLPAIPKP